MVVDSCLQLLTDDGTNLKQIALQVKRNVALATKEVQILMNNEPRESLGAAIRELRKYVGATLAEMGLEMEVTPSYISQLERNERSVTMPTYRKAVAALKVLADRKGLVIEDVPMLHKRTAHVNQYSAQVAYDGSRGLVTRYVPTDSDWAVRYNGCSIYDVADNRVLPAGIESGDRVVVRMGDAIRDCTVCMVTINGDTHLAGIKLASSIVLIESGLAIPVKPEDSFEIIGTVIEVHKPVKTDWIRSLTPPTP